MVKAESFSVRTQRRPVEHLETGFLANDGGKGIEEIYHALLMHIEGGRITLKAASDRIPSGRNNHRFIPTLPLRGMSLA